MTTDNTRTTYLVTWSIDITADSPQAAALIAKRMCNDMSFDPDDANVFEVHAPAYPGDADTQCTHTVDLGAAEITDDGEIIVEDTHTALDAPVDTADAAPDAAPERAVAGTDSDDTETLIVTEEITLEIEIDRTELRAAGIDPDDTESAEFDSYIADITSTLGNGRHAFSVTECERSCSWLN